MSRNVTVTVIENVLEADTWDIVETDDILKFCRSRFPEWPVTARIYERQVAECFDVTPRDEHEVQALSEKEGPFFIVVYPHGPVAIIVAVVAVATAAAVAYLLMPKIPNATERNIQQSSGNNELAERVNTQRINGRIPDIFGQVRSTPDLVMTPYKLFEANVEQEIAYMCIGKGEYAVSDIRDDDTLISDIQGASVEVYAPYTSPRTGDAPQLRIGSAIDASLKTVHRLTAVNGQTLRAPNADVVRTDNGVSFEYPNVIRLNAFYGGGMDRRFDIFAPGQVITLTRAVRTGTRASDGTPITVNLNGTYTIVSASAYSLTLQTPSQVNPAWNNLQAMTDEKTPLGSVAIEDNIDKNIGSFIIDRADTNELLLNFVALNGLYKDNGERQYKIDINVNIGVTPVDAAGAATGPEQIFTTTIVGSSASRDMRAQTRRIYFNPAIGRCRVRAWRTTNTDYAFEGSVVDEIKWRDCYALASPGRNSFGNVTTVFSKTMATAGALAVKERKLNMLVTRKLPLRIAGTSDFTTELSATRNAADIISFICMDRKIGNRPKSQIDFDNIYQTINQVQTYFGTADAVRFDYTFDKDNLSFEETLSTIASSVFCTAYRRGNTIKLSFEKETELSTLLLNHRNKIPGSETRTVNFGLVGDNDGVEYEYVSPEDDAIVTMYLPADQSARNPKKVQSVGVRSKLKAHFHANRIWNKIRYQNMTVECEVTQEAAVLVHMDRVLIADNTRPDTYDGEVVEQNGLVLTLSQPLPDENISINYSFLVQHIDGSVETLNIVTRTSQYSIQLANAPRLPLATDDKLFAKATYWLVRKTEKRPTAFLLTEKDTSDNFTFTIKAMNYDARYYANDSDFTNGVVDGDGNPV